MYPRHYDIRQNKPIGFFAKRTDEHENNARFAEEIVSFLDDSARQIVITPTC